MRGGVTAIQTKGDHGLVQLAMGVTKEVLRSSWVGNFYLDIRASRFFFPDAVNVRCGDKRGIKKDLRFLF